MPNVSVQCMITNLCSDKVCMQSVIDSKNMHDDICCENFLTINQSPLKLSKLNDISKCPIEL